jgi:hypothetical protein
MFARSLSEKTGTRSWQAGFAGEKSAMKNQP